jgi:hypothetical protein
VNINSCVPASGARGAGGGYRGALHVGIRTGAAPLLLSTVSGGGDHQPPTILSKVVRPKGGGTIRTATAGEGEHGGPAARPGDRGDNAAAQAVGGPPASPEMRATGKLRGRPKATVHRGGTETCRCTPERDTGGMVTRPVDDPPASTSSCGEMAYTQPTGSSSRHRREAKRGVHRPDASSVPTCMAEAMCTSDVPRARRAARLGWAVRYGQPPRETASHHKGLSSAPRV